MATAIATKPAPPHQKMKRPPPPTVQASVNGARSSQSSPSPSLSSKRPPSGFKHPPNSSVSNGINGNVNVGPRLSNRRRDSQKPGDIQGRQNRSGKAGQLDTIDRRSSKRMSEPYAKTEGDILKRYQNKPPSLILHLHPTHFRFEQGDDTYSYSSEMKVILEHIKTRTIPHDIMSELLHAGIKFYEGCLVVQVHDHKSTSTTSQASTSTSGTDKYVPFSIHNYNAYLTPSSYVPYPRVNAPKAESDPSRGSGSADSSDNAKKGNQDSSGKATVKAPRIFTVVLFPTPMSLEEEVLIFANTPDPRANNRKPSQHNSVNRTPSSATMPHPPTPLSAVPPTPSTSGPLAKKLKMLVGEKDIRSFESKAIQSTAPPLYLEPVSNLEDAQKILKSLTDPLHHGDYPAPKTRKRTVAELAADEALAAQEQRFMLTMDERLSLSASGAAGGKSKTADGEVGTASFEPRFERFKTLEAIKVAHAERAEREKEAKQQMQAQQAAAKAKHEQQEREARQMQEKKLAEHAAREIQMRDYGRRQAAQNQANTAANMQHTQTQEARQNQHANPPVSSGMLPNGQPHMVPVSQPHHSSPIVRNMTPHSNSSPLVGNAMVTHPGSVPMSVTASGQGNTSSPARPPSALQHGHPVGGAAMMHQRSQQPISRRGTPQMNGTPSMQHVTPVINHATPTSRMGHASPPNAMAQTPTLAQNNIAAQHLVGVGQQLTPEQQQVLMQNRFMQQQQQQHQLRLQNASPHSMSPGARPQVSMANLQQMANQRNHENYQQQQQQQQIRNYHQAMAGHAPNLANGVSPPNQHPGQQPPGQHPNQPGPAQQRPPGSMPHPNPAHAYLANIQQKAFQAHIANLQKQYGAPQNIPQELVTQARQQAVVIAHRNLKEQQAIAHRNLTEHQAMALQKQQAARVAAQQYTQQQQAIMAQMNANAVNGGRGGGGMGGMGGMQ